MSNLYERVKQVEESNKELEEVGISTNSIEGYQHVFEEVRNHNSLVDEVIQGLTDFTTTTKDFYDGNDSRKEELAECFGHINNNHLGTSVGMGILIGVPLPLFAIALKAVQGIGRPKDKEDWKLNRRNFLKLSGLAGAGLLCGTGLGYAGAEDGESRVIKRAEYLDNVVRDVYG